MNGIDPQKGDVENSDTGARKVLKKPYVTSKNVMLG
jgi:hypothetical protein